MRFNFDAYAKVFPETEEPKVFESAVDTFKPTEEKAKDHQPGEEPKVFESAVDTFKPTEEKAKDPIETPEDIPENKEAPAEPESEVKDE